MQPMEAKALGFLGAAKQNIANIIDLEVACGQLAELCKFKKSVDAQVKALCEPYKKELDAVQAQYKNTIGIIKQAEADLRLSTSQFATMHRNQMLSRLAQQNKGDKALAEIDRLEAEKAAADDYDEITAALYRQRLEREQEQIYNEALAPDNYTLANEFATFRVKVEPDIVDVSQLPREYLVPDVNKIKADIEAGKSIPGVNTITRLITVLR